MTYIQASGRTSRMYAGGITKGLSIVIVDDAKLLEGLIRRSKWVIEDIEWKPLEDLDLDAVLKEIDRDRALIREISMGKIRPEFKDPIKTALMIVESPNKARTIASFFGKPSIRRRGRLKVYEVSTGDRILMITASGGHVYDIVTEDKMGFHGVLTPHEHLTRGFLPVYTSIKKCLSCGYQFSGDNSNKCPKCGKPLKEYSKMELDIRKIFETSEKRGILINKSKMHVKGVKGLSSAKKIPEILDKAILRAKYNIFVFKDGTVRFDATDAPLTHFRPREIGASIETLKKLGYTRDIYGDPLTSEDQILELKVQDIIISKHAGDYLLRVSKFIDELLEKVYGLPSYYNCNKKEDLIGHLVIGLAPHTSAGIIGRIIGFTKSQVTFAHPFWHAAKRRNCDGDEDSIILLLDGFLNFSKSFLPKKRGGTMDAPLVLTIYLNPFEVDDESWNLDVMKRYPYEFYQLTHRFVSPKEALEYIEIAEKRL